MKITHVNETKQKCVEWFSAGDTFLYKGTVYLVISQESAEDMFLLDPVPVVELDTGMRKRFSRGAMATPCDTELIIKLREL